ncbi:MAG: TonB-dependent receptor [Chromatiales bacterium]|nr:MAG: TonB-dependent receptor [Chromatiales bacterium]
MRYLILVLLSAAMLSPGPLLAQGAGTLDEILVTAQRREQSAQDIPIAITAFDGDTLKRANITEASQFLSLTPNVSFTQDGQVGSRGISIGMRGVSNINTDESSFIQSIGVYLDDFSVASVGQGTINPQLQDLQRIEVLRGPQGTFFGRNAVGGALNLVTNKPVDEFDTYVTVGGRSFDGDGEQYDIEGMVNIPITDGLFFRGVGYYEDSDGLVENKTPGGNDSDHTYYMLRGALRWVPTDRTTFDLMAMYTNEDQDLDENVPSGVWDTDSVATFFLPQPVNPPDVVAPGITTPVNPGGVGFWDDNTNEHARSAMNENTQNDTTAFILNVEHGWNDDITLNFVAGYIDTNTDRLFDNDLVPENLVFREQERHGESYSFEGRFNWSVDAFDLIGGVLFSHDEKEIENAVQRGGDDVVNGVDFAAIGSLPPAFLNGVFGRPFCLACSEDDFEMDSYAFFGDFTWHATDQLDLIVGGRYTVDDVEQKFFAIGADGTPRWPSATFTEGDTLERKENYDDFSPRIGATYSFNDDVNVYGIVSKGYKAGGFSLGVNTSDNSAIDTDYDEEELWNYEIGLKSEWFDNTLRLNLSAFYLEWSDLQLETFFFLTPGDPTSNVELTINVDDAEAKGFEVESIWVPTERITVTAALGYVDTEITSDEQARLSGNIFVSLEDEELPRSPEWTWSSTAEYRLPLGDNEAWFRAEWIFRDEMFSTIEDVTYQQTSNQPICDTICSDPGAVVLGQVPDRSNGFPFKGDDYHVVNLRAGFLLGQGWEFVGWIENVFDEDYFAGTGENFGLSGFRLRPHPTTYGASVTWRFQ